MLILTIQRKEICESILKGNYIPNIWESDYALLSNRFTKGYKKILNTLEDKTGRYLSDSESCYWGWVYNPYTKFFYPGEEYKAIFINVPESEIVFSDYDLYSDYVHEDSYNDNFILENLQGVKKSDCIQCSFLSCNPKNICLVSDLSSVDNLRGTIGDIYIKALIRDSWLELSRSASKARFIENLKKYSTYNSLPSEV